MKWEEKDLSQFFHHNIDLENYSFDFVQDQPSSMNKNWKRVYKSYRHAHSKVITLLSSFIIFFFSNL